MAARNEITCWNRAAALAFPVAGTAGVTDEGTMSKEVGLCRRKMLQIGLTERTESQERCRYRAAWRRPSTQ
jgi:hypothetical protein